MAEVIVALDHDSAVEALALVDRLTGVRWAKIGPTLYVREGPAIIRALRDRGVQVFLDLKWHDIPNQVAGAVRAAADLGVALATLHALGGAAMLDAARRASDTIRLAAVTVLTSHAPGALGEILGRPDARPESEALRLARLAMRIGLDGLVASAAEVALLRHELGNRPWLVVPGIRPAGSPGDDQMRTAEARVAAAAGASHLVVGRPISRAVDPLAVYQALCAEAA